jgi:hypothetical protein
VKIHLYSIYQKLRVSNRAGLILRANESSASPKSIALAQTDGLIFFLRARPAVIRALQAFLDGNNAEPP